MQVARAWRALTASRMGASAARILAQYMRSCLLRPCSASKSARLHCRRL